MQGAAKARRGGPNALGLQLQAVRAPGWRYWEENPGPLPEQQHGTTKLSLQHQLVPFYRQLAPGSEAAVTW